MTKYQQLKADLEAKKIDWENLAAQNGTLPNAEEAYRTCIADAQELIDKEYTP